MAEEEEEEGDGDGVSRDEAAGSRCVFSDDETREAGGGGEDLERNTGAVRKRDIRLEEGGDFFICESRFLLPFPGYGGRSRNILRGFKRALFQIRSFINRGAFLFCP